MDEMIIQGDINSRILTLRAKQVMLDKELKKALDELIAASEIAKDKVMGFLK